MMGMNKTARILTVLLLGLLQSACSTFGETHYFSSINTATGEVANVFRMKVSGQSDLSDARYLAGYYDERAVDIFFNEVDSASYDTVARNGNDLAGIPKFWGHGCTKGLSDADCVAEYKGKLSTVPLGENPDGNHNAFVLILSTKADAISETIGAIAEDNIMKQTLFRMANKDTFAQKSVLDATKTTNGNERNAVLAELEGLFNTLPTDLNTSHENDYLAVLSALAGGLSPNAPVRFNRFEDAEAWFNSYNIGEGS